MKISRRSVLAASASTPALAGVPAFAANQRVAIVTEIGNPAANSPPVNNALNKLRQALTEQGAFVETVAAPPLGLDLPWSSPRLVLSWSWPRLVLRWPAVFPQVAPAWRPNNSALRPASGRG